MKELAVVRPVTKSGSVSANAATGTDGVLQCKLQSQRESERRDASACIVDFKTSNPQNAESPAQNDSMRGIAMSSVERLTGIEPATFSLGS
jgi:hypothetical protein